MICNYLLLCLFGISTCFLAVAVAREAIVHGLIDYSDSFLYQVSVQGGGSSRCGGGIIGDRFILTAARCVFDSNGRRLSPNFIFVIAGTKNLNYNSPGTVTRRVEKVFIPSEYHPTAEFNHGDIAVLQLADSLQLQYHVHLRKLKLPRYVHYNETAIIAGFGWNQYERVSNVRQIGNSDGRLRFAVTNIFYNERCEQLYPVGAIQSEKHLCAESCPSYGSNSRYGVCNGDHGGPLVQSKTTVIGILTRLPSDCDERHEPGVYTYVSHYVRMILNVMEHGHDPEMILLQY